MLSLEVARLREVFDGWNSGKPLTPEDWFRFRDDLTALVFKVAMLELGVDLTVVDVAVEAAKPDTRVVLFPVHRTRRPIEPGEGCRS